MLRQIENKIWPKNNKKIVEKLLHRIVLIREKYDVIVLFGSPTEGNWKGIANATIGLFPNNSLQIPQWYSNPVLNKKEASAICKLIKDSKFEKVIISGFANYFFEWIELLKEGVKIEIIFHGTISEFHEKEKQQFIGNLIKLGNLGSISRFGFVKEGLDQVFKTLYGFDSFHQPLSNPILPTGLHFLQLDKSKIHVGVFGADTFNKNLHNQVIHALMIEDVIVHVLDKSIFEYLNLSDRIIEHGKNLDKNHFLSILGSMDLNLYISFNESWGLVKHESEALGVTCISSSNFEYFQVINDILLKIKS
jgi:glycosyltransferase involved in cell wall biosynthesis